MRGIYRSSPTLNEARVWWSHVSLHHMIQAIILRSPSHIPSQRSGKQLFYLVAVSHDLTWDLLVRRVQLNFLFMVTQSHRGGGVHVHVHPLLHGLPSSCFIFA